jgi:hypothetical protein
MSNSKCRMCDGFGIITLIEYSSTAREIPAPCIECSPTRSLQDLIAEKQKYLDQVEMEAVRKRIREHNAWLAQQEGRVAE